MPAITDVNDLQDMENDLAGDYYLANDIDASATVGWNGGAGFVPIGQGAPYFTGTFDMKGHTITGLFINRPGTDYVGLFGITRGASIRDGKLEDIDITGDDYVGGMVGFSYDGTEFTNCQVSGEVNGDFHLGGFVGWAGATAVTDTFTRCSSDVDVTGPGSDDVGGFAGEASFADFSECYSMGNVSNGWGNAGGFISDVYGANAVSTFTNCYARGNVHAAGSAGGFICVEAVWGTGSVIFTNCYSTGAVTSDIADLGGFALGDSGATTYNDCFWDTETSGTAVSAGGTGKTTAQMKNRSTFTDAGWDFIIIWAINGITNDGYPFFWAMPPEPPPDAPRRTVAVQDKISLECIRNVEMAAGGRFYINEEGKAVYRSRYARHPPA